MSTTTLNITPRNGNGKGQASEDHGITLTNLVDGLYQLGCIFRGYVVLKHNTHCLDHLVPICGNEDCFEFTLDTLENTIANKIDELRSIADGGNP